MGSSDFWRPNEETIESYEHLVAVIEDVFIKWRTKDKVFAWRGQVCAEWPLHSSLYRREMWTRGVALEERDLARSEGKILAKVHKWGLHAGNGTGRLSVLAQLATLQHFGAPTRLVDVTFNPWIAAWFAVEQKWDNAVEKYQDQDARLFAVDVTGRLINESSLHRQWEDSLKRPWPTEDTPEFETPEQKAAHATMRKTWSTKVFAWRAPHYNSRIAAQNGGFLLGGVPTSQGPAGPNQWPKEGGGAWLIDEVRTATSLSLRPHKLRVERGGVSQDAVYSMRIRAHAKPEIRDRLEKSFAYGHSTIYPDYTGFAAVATPELKTRQGA